MTSGRGGTGSAPGTACCAQGGVASDPKDVVYATCAIFELGAQLVDKPWTSRFRPSLSREGYIVRDFALDGLCRGEWTGPSCSSPTIRARRSTGGSRSGT